MFKLHFLKRNQTECMKSYNWFYTFCTTKTCPLLWKYMFIGWTWWKPNHTRISKSWNFERKGRKAKDSFYEPFDKRIMFNGFKMSSFRCRSHVHEILLPKKMFGWPLKLILGFLGIFYIFGIKPKYSYKIMYKCEESPLPHESYIGPLNFLHLSLFHVNIICKK